MTRDLLRTGARCKARAFHGKPRIAGLFRFHDPLAPVLRAGRDR